MVLLVSGCAKSATRLGYAKDAGSETAEEGKGASDEDRENGDLSSDADSGANAEADAETQIGYVDSAGGEGTVTGGMRIDDSGDGGTIEAGFDFADIGIAGAGGYDELLPRPGTDGGPPIEVIVLSDNILNPMECEADLPFVLGINPDGNSGFVSGWLGNAPVVTFDGEIPRFEFEGNGDEESLILFWSIASTGSASEPSVHFYGDNDATLVALADDVDEVQEITDATSLLFDNRVVSDVRVGEIVVFHHLTTDRYLALRLDAIYQSDSAEPSDDCFAINASWTFAPKGSADFSNVELPDDNIVID